MQEIWSEDEFPESVPDAVVAARGNVPPSHATCTKERRGRGRAESDTTPPLTDSCYTRFAYRVLVYTE